MENKENISRRDFLRLGGYSAASFLVPRLQKTTQERLGQNESWPTLDREALPEGEIKEVLGLIPEISINNQGYLTNEGKRVRFVETQWSKDNRTPINPDSIVIHWNGQDGADTATSKNLLNGYNQERVHQKYGYEYTTSAHTTIGPYSPNDSSAKENDYVSITQSQKPENGWPTIASHLRSVLTEERVAFRNAQHPLNPMYTLCSFYELPENHNFLFEVLNSHWGEDLNFRTIGLELIGSDFDGEGHPEPQLIANTLGVVFAYKERYPNISFSNITGHNEIQMDKPDPGKGFMAEVRLLIGLKVLLDGTEEQKNELFAPYLTESRDPMEAVKRYFDFHWDSLAYSNWAHPKKVFDWEEKTNYWNIYNTLFEENPVKVAKDFRLPVDVPNGLKLVIGNELAKPDYHEGVDLNVQSQKGGEINEDLGQSVKATANGKVVFKGHIAPSNNHEQNLGNTIVLKHTTKEGGKALSLYAHLEEDIKVEVGQEVEVGQAIGTMGNSGGQADSHLHFSIFPKATLRQEEFEHYLQMRYRGQEFNPSTKDETGKIFVVPTSTHSSSIQRKYFDPIEFIEANSRNYEGFIDREVKLQRMEQSLR